ncbi:MAG: PsbP-related protein [Nitrososphaeraceae archaeon]
MTILINMYISKPNTAKNTVISSLYSMVAFFILAFYYFLLFSVATGFSSQYAVGQTMISKNFLIYENPAYGFKIQYPSDWEKIEFTGGVEEGHRKIIINFVSPLESASDNFREYFIIERGSIEPQATLSLQHGFNSYVTSLKSLPDFKLIESNIFSLGDRPAEKLIYSYSNPEVGVTKTTDILVIKDEKVYLLSFNSDADKYNNYLPTIQKMVGSFQFR